MFELNIKGVDFHQNRLKVVSMASLIVTVLNEQGQAVENFTTHMGQNDYIIQTPLTDGHTVHITVAPGEQIEFYPVVQAL